MIRCINCGHDGYVDDCECCQNFEHCENCKQMDGPIAHDDCEVPACWCCPCHHEYPCPGGADGMVVVETYGGLQSTPWDLRGEKLTPNTKYPSWQVAWPNLASMHGQLDVCQKAADFYVLDALRHALINREHECNARPCRHFELWDRDLTPERREANAEFESLVTVLDLVFREYVEMACGGELRHHNACGGKALSPKRRTAWADWKWIHDQLGDQALLDGAELFDQFPSGAFGGAKWAHALRLLHKRATNQITAITYVDQVFTLVHNGGVFLNKLDWHVGNDLGWNLHYLQANVLPAQEQDAWGLLLKVASKNTRQMWDRYWRHSNKARLSMAVPPAVNTRAHPRRRLVCFTCGSNPNVGHMLNCGQFVTGALQAGNCQTRNVIEEQWGDYAWERWELDRYPLGPRGEVIMLPEMAYRIWVEVHTSYAVKIRKFQGTATTLMKQTMKFVRALPTVPGWEEKEGTEYWFVVQLLDSRERVRLGAFESRRTTNLEAFKQKYVTFGHILPLVMPDIEWKYLAKELV